MLDPPVRAAYGPKTVQNTVKTNTGDRIAHFTFI